MSKTFIHREAISITGYGNKFISLGNNYFVSVGWHFNNYERFIWFNSAGNEISFKKIVVYYYNGSMALMNVEAKIDDKIDILNYAGFHEFLLEFHYFLNVPKINELESNQVSNPIKITQNIPHLPSRFNRETGPIRKLIAKYDYDPRICSPNPDAPQVELTFRQNDIITIFGEMDDDGFYLGKLNGVKGMVPSNFLRELTTHESIAMEKSLENDLFEKELMTNESGKQISHRGIQAQVRTLMAKYDYDPRNCSQNPHAYGSELTFNVGDIITIYDDMDHDGYYFGEFNGVKGMFPFNFVENPDTVLAKLALSNRLKKESKSLKCGRVNHQVPSSKIWMPEESEIPYNPSKTNGKSGDIFKDSISTTTTNSKQGSSIKSTKSPLKRFIKFLKLDYCLSENQCNEKKYNSSIKSFFNILFFLLLCYSFIKFFLLVKS